MGCQNIVLKRIAHTECQHIVANYFRVGCQTIAFKLFLHVGCQAFALELSHILDVTLSFRNCFHILDIKILFVSHIGCPALVSTCFTNWMSSFCF